MVPEINFERWLNLDLDLASATLQLCDLRWSAQLVKKKKKSNLLHGLVEKTVGSEVSVMLCASASHGMVLNKRWHPSARWSPHIPSSNSFLLPLNIFQEAGSQDPVEMWYVCKREGRSDVCGSCDGKVLCKGMKALKCVYLFLT